MHPNGNTRARWRDWRILTGVSLALLAILVWPAAPPTSGQALGASIDAVLQQAGPPDETIRVIVRYRPSADLEAEIGLVDAGALVRQHLGIRAVSLQIRRDELDGLTSNPEVESVSVDARVALESLGAVTVSLPKISLAEPTLNLPPYDNQKLRATLGLTPAQTGAGVGVAIVDSGVILNDDLAASVVEYFDFTAGGNPDVPSDGYGHGTHVAGLIAGSGAKSSGQYVGIAPGARLIVLKALDNSGQGYTSDVVAALEFVTQYRAALGVDVLNLSLGHPIFEAPETDPLVQAVERAVQAGIVVVVSAGNHGTNPKKQKIGYAGITSPGNAPSALTVGAFVTNATAGREDDTVAPFSSRGPTWFDGRLKPDVVAPGASLIAISDPSTKLYQQHQSLRADVVPYLKLSGTSMAAAVVSGVVALMIQANRLDEGGTRPLTPNTVKALLQYTALPLPATRSEALVVLDQGAGGINGAGAIELARIIDPGAPSGAPWLETGVSPHTAIAGTTYTWGQVVGWSDYRVTGESAFARERGWDQDVVWSRPVVWGPNLLRGPNVVMDAFSVWRHWIVWGMGSQHVVWGDDHVVWGDDHVVWGDSEHVVWGDSLE